MPFRHIVFSIIATLLLCTTPAHAGLLDSLTSESQTIGFVPKTADNIGKQGVAGGIARLGNAD